MKKNTIILSITACLMLLAPTFCGDSTDLMSTTKPETFHRYLWANYNHFSGNLTHANNWYKKIFSSPSSVYTYKGYLTFLADTKEYKKIIELMPSVNKKFDQDPDIQLIFVDALAHLQQDKKAENLLITLSQSFKTHPDIALRAAQAYITRREPENALLTINAFVNNTPRKPNNFIFYFLQSHIYVQLNQFPHALTSIEKCLEMHPHFDKGWLLYASLNEQEGKIKEALSGYTTFLELAGSNPQVQQHLFALVNKQKAIQTSKQQLISRTISLENALVLCKQGQYENALNYVDHCIAKEPDNNQYKLLKVEILVVLKRFNHAASTIAAWIVADKENSIWPKTLSILAYNGMPRTEIIQAFSTILAQQPDNLWCNLYCADILMRAQESENAIPYLAHALSQQMDNKLKSRIAYQLALVHYETNNESAMLTYLQQAYGLNSDCPHTNNALAYYWATKGKDVSKAHPFIAQSLKYDSTNPYFLDTQALILYKEKKYLEAQTILEKLVNHNNSTILLHLAKVHCSLNNKDIAHIFTQKAEALVKNNQEKRALEKMKVLLAQG